MNLVRHDPWYMLRQLQLQQDMNTLFPHRLATDEESGAVVTSDWAPAVDIKEKADYFLVLADVPGVSPEDIEVTMENGMLSIKGERQEEHTEEKEGYKRTERSFGSFHRRFSLPDSANPEGITAKSRNGSLEIIVPKQEEVSASRRIAVEH